MNARRTAALLVVALTLGMAGLSFAATAPGSSAVSASVSTTISLTVTAGAVLSFGSVAPGTCAQLGNLALNDRAVILTITSNAPWNVSFASSHATGRMTNGTVTTINPVQFEKGDLAGSTPFADMTSAPVSWYAASQPAAASAQVFGAVRWCAAALEPVGSYSKTISYLLTVP